GALPTIVSPKLPTQSISRSLIADVVMPYLRGSLPSEGPAMSFDVEALILDIYRYHYLWYVPDITLGSVSLRNLIRKHLSAPRPATQKRCPKCGGNVCQPYKSTETGLWTQRCDKCEWFDSWAVLAAAPEQKGEKP